MKATEYASRCACLASVVITEKEVRYLDVLAQRPMGAYKGFCLRKASISRRHC